MIEPPPPCEYKFQSTRPVRSATTLTLLDTSNHLFQSTRPVRSATRPCIVRAVQSRVSIHAPREERDSHPGDSVHHANRRFNPRAP